MVVMVVLVTGCSSGRDDAAGAASTTTTQPPGAFVDVSDLESEGMVATRVTPTLDGKPFDGGIDRYGLVGIGGTLIAGLDGNEPLTGLASSTDEGETWRSVRFPDTPHRWHNPTLLRTADAVVVTADDVRTSSDTTFIWTTTEGVAWRGGEITMSRGVGHLIGDGGQLPDGTLIIPVGPGDLEEQRALTSSDGGASWHEGECPPVATAEGLGCQGLTSAGRGLWAGRYEVSLDEGRTWQPFEVNPDPVPTGVQQLGNVVALADAGWLGAVADFVVRSDQIRYLPYLARSSDGIVWEPVLTDSCSDMSYPNATGFSKPVAFGDGWLVSHDCVRDSFSVRSELHLLDSTGANPRLVARMDAGDADHPGDVHFGTPVAVGDTVIVPEIDFSVRDRLRILRLQPAN